MPRKAREKIPFGTYLIHQSCVGGKPLFESDEDRRKFLRILKEKKDQFHFKLYGYCMADPNAYSIVVYDNGSDISKIMKSVNISYAHCIKARGKVFGGRYKSTLIKSPEELHDTLNTLHEGKPCCSYSSNSFKELLDSEIYFSLPDGKPERVFTLEDEASKLCLCSGSTCTKKAECIRTLEEGEAFIAKTARDKNISVEQFIENKGLRNLALLEFRKRTTLSLKEIGILFGGLSESAVCKIISRETERRGIGNGF